VLSDPLPEAAEGPVPETDPLPAEAGDGAPPGPDSFEKVVALFAEHREAILHAHLMGDVHLVRFEPGRIEFRPGAGAPANLANRLGELLNRWTGRRWVVSVSRQEGAPTLKQQAAAAAARMRREAAAHPAVRAVLDAFPGATIEAVRERRRGPPTPTPGSNDGDEAP
jgi:DNA polymerase-3 subunit gamma/tau